MPVPPTMGDVVRGASANTVRARQLLTGAAIGGHTVAVVCVATFWFVQGPAAGMSAAVAAVVVLAFSMIGQAVQVLVADAPAKTVMIAALASYGFRVSALGIVLILALDSAPRLEAMDPIAVVVTTIVVVFGWLATEFWVYARLRIPIYDEPDDRRPITPQR